jgi:glycine dehydrogenase subunit 2
MYFPLIVHEALMVEPTETETKETLGEVIAIYKELYDKAYTDPDSMHNSPATTPVGRPDEVAAARNPILRFF